MSLLTVIQYVCGRTNLPVPATIIGTTDTQVLQMLRLLEEEGMDLSARGGWQGITFEANHTTIALEDQGAISTIASNGFDYMKNETIWDRTTRLPVCGPMNSAEWQAMKAFTTTGPSFRYRIRGGKLLVNPVPAAGDSWYFEYVSDNWILGIDGTTYKKYFTLDTDTILLPEKLVLLGLRWRWKKEKSLAYQEDFNTYEIQVANALSRDGGKPRIDMDTPDSRGPRPGILVPEGNWI